MHHGELNTCDELLTRTMWCTRRQSMAKLCMNQSTKPSRHQANTFMALTTDLSVTLFGMLKLKVFWVVYSW